MLFSCVAEKVKCLIRPVNSSGCDKINIINICTFEKEHNFTSP